MRREAMIPTHLPRRLFLIGASSLALSACGDILGPPEAAPIYTVTPKFPAPANGAATGAKVPWALAVLRPTAAAGLDNDRISLIQPDGTMDFYAKATYPDRLSPIVQQALLNGFESSGRIDAVAQEQDALHADYNLVTEIKDFRAHFAVADGIPDIAVALTVKLTNSHGRNIVSSFSTIKTGTASANSAAAVAQALQQALAAAVTEIVNWTLTAPMPATLQPAKPASAGKEAEQLLHETTRGSEGARNAAPH
jgi:cholesterol transport system auxiliary component